MKFKSVPMFAAVAWAALIVAACGSSPTSSSSSSSTSASASPSASVASSPVVLAKTVGSMGTLLVGASDGMTLYTFAKDTPGVSNCSGQCAVTWPPLTVPSGQTPTGGDGVTGQLATITRSDGTIQVTYKGLPLYFFHNDASPGDTKGNYTNWSLVHP
jgi:predicted lipoprotein with Yx(FWY)xxD motif